MKSKYITVVILNFDHIHHKRDLNENIEPTGIIFPQATLTPENKDSAQQKGRFHAAIDRSKQVAEGPKDERSYGFREQDAQDIKAQRTRHTLLYITQ
jgi:hypothetical protein